MSSAVVFFFLFVRNMTSDLICSWARESRTRFIVRFAWTFYFIGDENQPLCWFHGKHNFWEMITKPEAIQLALTKKSSEAEQKSLPWVGEQTRRLWTSLCCRGRDVKTNFMANSVKKAFEGGQLEWANERRTRERFECKCLLSRGAGGVVRTSACR